MHNWHSTTTSISITMKKQQAVSYFILHQLGVAILSVLIILVVVLFLNVSYQKH